MDKNRLFIKIYGLVQGVNFRYYTQKQAQKLDLLGWARNALDGTVEIEVEGEKENLVSLWAWAQKGPRGAIVEKVEHFWQEFKGEFDDFVIY